MLQEEPRTLRFDRRQSDRWPVDGVATIFELAGDRFGRIHALRGLDYSDGGLGATCDTTIPPGSTVSVGFQKPGYLSQRGTVIRCLPCGDGYRIAVAFERRLAA